MRRPSATTQSADGEDAEVSGGAADSLRARNVLPRGPPPPPAVHGDGMQFRRRGKHGEPQANAVESDAVASFQHSSDSEDASSHDSSDTKGPSVVCLELVGHALERARDLALGLQRWKLNATRPAPSSRSVAAFLGWAKRSFQQWTVSRLLTDVRLRDWQDCVRKKDHA